MEGKNLILAICLSALVLIFWSIFFAPPPPTIDKQENRIEKIQKDEDSKISSPSLETTAKTKMMSRVDSLKETKRISLENNNIVGSISLTFLGRNRSTMDPAGPVPKSPEMGH